MERVYTNMAFDPLSGHYVGSTAIAVPFQAYDEEGEIQIGPEGGFRSWKSQLSYRRKHDTTD